MITTRELTIGKLAHAAGVNVETVRYYQRIGLINEPAKPLGGSRYYPAEFVNRIRFIKRAQQLGFSLREIADLLELGDGQCDDVRKQAEAKLGQIESQIRDLQAMRKTLKELVAECVSGKKSSHCPIIQSLADKP